MLRVYGITKEQIIVKREVVSGDTIMARPVIQEVLQLIESDDIKGVLVVEVERLARRRHQRPRYYRRGL